MALKKSSSAKSIPALEGKTSAKKVAAKKSLVQRTGTTKKQVVAAKKTTVKKVRTQKLTAGKKAATTKKTPAKGSKTKLAKSNSVKNAAQSLVDAAVEGVLEIKGKNISILDLKNIHNRVCDYYIICQADSSTQVNAIAGSVEEMVKKRTGERPYHTEGFQNSEWVLVDYVTVVVHVFQSHIREFYNLEALWADAEITKIAFD